MYTWHQKNQLNLHHPFQIFYQHCGIAFQKHWHEELEVIYVKQGAARANISGITYDVGAGGIIFVGSKESHEYTTESDAGISLIFDLSPVVFADHRERVANSRFRAPVLKRPAVGDPGGAVHTEFVRLFESIIAAKENTPTACDLLLQAKVLELAWMILDKLELLPMSHEQKVKLYTNNEKINEILHLIDEDCQQDWDLNTVARLCSFSPNYFARLFRESVGVPFCKYLNGTRVRQAKTLLMETETPITAVSYMVGFSSLQTFDRVFRSAFGISPSEYRRLGLSAAPTASE